MLKLELWADSNHFFKSQTVGSLKSIEEFEEIRRLGRNTKIRISNANRFEDQSYIFDSPDRQKIEQVHWDLRDSRCHTHTHTATPICL